LLSTIFAPYGLNLWDKLSPAASLLVAIAATIALILFVIAWRRHFALGPFEWILRRITQLGIPR